jgi:hypothetical protein
MDGNGSSIRGRIYELRGYEFDEKFVICVKLCFLIKCTQALKLNKVLYWIGPWVGIAACYGIDGPGVESR